MVDLKPERAAVATAIDSAGAEPVLFERFGGRDDEPERAYLSEVHRSTIYLAILGDRYVKRLMPSRRSAIHDENREAEQTHLRICAWVRYDKTIAARPAGSAQPDFHLVPAVGSKGSAKEMDGS